MSLPLLMASAPNGAYKTREDHDQLPVTAAQLAATAAAVQPAGARMLHLHVRDAAGKHTLDAAAYHAAINAIRATVGDDLFIQITSEAAGVYNPAQQRQAIRAVCREGGVDGVSIAPRELAAASADVAPAQKLFQHLAEREIFAQYILYSVDDIKRYHRMCEQEIIPRDAHSVLLVIGRYGEQISTPEILRQMIGALKTPEGNSPNWMVCAFGEQEFSCLNEAAKLGGHIRIGFENTLKLKTGKPAANNRELITQFTESANQNNRPLATKKQTREILASVIL